VVAIEPIHFGNAIFFAFENGSTEYRDWRTWEEVYKLPQPRKVMTVESAGFELRGSPSGELA